MTTQALELHRQDLAQPIKQKVVEQNKQAQLAQKVEIEKAQGSKPDSPVRFEVISENGQVKLQTLPNTQDVDFSTVFFNEEEVEAPKVLSLLGYKIDLKARIDYFKESYLKNYALSKSHNLLVARLAEFKIGFLGVLLSLLGVSTEELQKLQKKAIQNSIVENKILFEENEYNGELIAIIGGPKKQVRGQQVIIKEIRTQLLTHAQRLGIGGDYARDRIIEIRLDACRKILLKFQEEKMHLEYEMALRYGG